MSGRRVHAPWGDGGPHAHDLLQEEGLGHWGSETPVSAYKFGYFLNYHFLYQICEFASPLDLEKRIAALLSKQLLTSAEICAVCIGIFLKKYFFVSFYWRVLYFSLVTKRLRERKMLGRVNVTNLGSKLQWYTSDFIWFFPFVLTSFLIWGNRLLLFTGLKKITGFTAAQGDLRYHLYESLYDIGTFLSSKSESKLPEEQLEIERLAVLQVTKRQEKSVPFWS